MLRWAGRRVAVPAGWVAEGRFAASGDWREGALLFPGGLLFENVKIEGFLGL